MQRISGAAELIQAVPYLLGFHPHRSLVIVGLDAGLLVVTARLDLDDAAAPGLVADTVAAMTAGGATAVIAAVYDDDVEAFGPGEQRLPAWSGVVDLVRDAAAACGAPVVDAVAVRGRVWRSYLRELDGSGPPSGTELPDRVSCFVAEATLAGRAPLADRAAVEALLDPVPHPDPERLSQLIADAESAAVAAALAGGRARYTRTEVRALFAAARASRAIDWAGVPSADLARFGVALSAITVRDPVWMGVDDGRIDGRSLWRDLGRRLPAPYSAAPMFLFGWTSWRAGDGALASIAAERSVSSDPSYTAADLLRAALNRGVDPLRLPRLRLPRSA